MKDVLLVTRPIGPPWNEGGKNLAYGIAKNIKNHRIHLLVRKDFNEKVDNNLVLHKIYPSNCKRKISYIEKLKLFLFLLKIKDIDIYHFIYTPELYSSKINRLLMKFKSNKSIQTIPTTIKKISNIKKLIFSDKVVAISDFTKNLLLKKGIKNVIKINTGIDTNYFRPFKKDTVLLNKLGLYKKFIVFIPIDLEKERGSRIMLKLIKDINNLEDIVFIFSYRATKKRISEEKYLRSNLIRMGLSKKVLFIKDPKDIRDLINISDIIIYSAVNTYEKHEIPMILIESMSMEKLIIIFDVASMNEIIKGNEGIKVKDYLAMKNIVIKLFEDKNLCKKIGKLARRRVVNDFNIIKTAKDYSELYRGL